MMTLADCPTAGDVDLAESSQVSCVKVKVLDLDLDFRSGLEILTWSWKFQRWTWPKSLNYNSSSKAYCNRSDFGFFCLAPSP